MNFASGWKTYTVGIATILVAALGAIPASWTNSEVAGILGVVMIVLRAITVSPAGFTINRTFGVALVGLLALGTSGVGCTRTLASAGIEVQHGDCNDLALGVAFAEPLLMPKCNRAPDPTTDEACLSLASMKLLVVACRIAADSNDAKAVAMAQASFKDTQAKVPEAVPPES